ncbi:MAG: DNA-directed RNA polymerase subunit alpha C-terminal domain-containing protein [Planctomycetota bacterium]
MNTGTLATAEPQSFDIKTSAIPSFAALQNARVEVFSRRAQLESFKQKLAGMSEQGEEGRRRALGWWMAGEFARAATELAKFESDNVAAFTRAKALMTLSRPAEALPIFERLSKAYPDEPRPRSGLLEARLEADLASGDDVRALEQLEAGLQAAGAAFAASAEGQYLAGRAREIDHDFNAAVEHYQQARDLDPAHRANLFRLGYVAEHAGDDEVGLEAYETLARMLPIDRNVLINLGVLYEDRGRHDDAAACYDVASRNQPTDARLRRFLADAVSGIHMYYDEDMERKEDRLNQILRIPITDFELSVRARNCLNKMNILTLGDLVKQTEAELLSYKNFGETSLTEIKEILGSKGLRLGMAREEAVASIEAQRRRYAVGENAEMLNKAVTELELSIRARRAVESMGCITVGDILQHSEEELLAMPNFGATSLQELRQKLATLGLKLRPKP